MNRLVRWCAASFVFSQLYWAVLNGVPMWRGLAAWVCVWVWARVTDRFITEWSAK